MTTHRMYGTPEYGSWAAMKSRCLNKNNPRYHRYGHRGIKVCERWMTFENFYADMGKSNGMTIERIDNDGDYEPGNCKWVSHREQGKNTCRIRYLTHNGLTLSIAEWSRRTGIKATTITQRLNAYGWSVDRALTEGGVL